MSYFKLKKIIIIILFLIIFFPITAIQAKDECIWRSETICQDSNISTTDEYLNNKKTG